MRVVLFQSHKHYEQENILYRGGHYSHLSILVITRLTFPFRETVTCLLKFLFVAQLNCLFNDLQMSPTKFKRQSVSPAWLAADFQLTAELTFCWQTFVACGMCLNKSQNKTL